VDVGCIAQPERIGPLASRGVAFRAGKRCSSERQNAERDYVTFVDMVKGRHHISMFFVTQNLPSRDGRHGVQEYFDDALR
jgi:hypothetical protein